MKILLRSLFGIDAPWLSQWLTPIWVFSLGCAAGLLILLLCWGIVYLIGKAFKPAARVADSVPEAVNEGILFPIFWLLVGFSVFSVLGVFVAPDPGKLLAAAGRLHYNSTPEATVDIEAPDASGKETLQAIDVRFYGDEVQLLNFLSRDENIRIVLDKPAEGEAADDAAFAMNVRADTLTSWVKTNISGNPFAGREVEQLYVLNRGEGPTELTVKIVSRPPYPEMASVWWVAAGVAGFFLFYFFVRIVFPKISAVATSTAKSEISQPAYLLAIAGGGFLLFVFVFIPYNTFGEDIKMLKDTSMMMIMVLGIGLAVWAATKSVSDEVEGKTALTVLSKPIGRRQFILGKFLGILWMAALLFILLGAVFLFTTAYKPIFDAREGSGIDVTWQECHRQMFSIIPGLMLAFMETMVMASISVAISTRLPLLANFTICFAIYALGHLTPLMVQSTQKGFEIVRFFSQFIATVAPVLDHFKIHAAIAADKTISPVYLATTLVYALIYSSIAMLLALISFEDRDLT